MAKKPVTPRTNTGTRGRAETPAVAPAAAASSIDELMLAAMERGGESLETGRYLVTFKEGALEEGCKALKEQSMQLADARDFGGQAVDMDALGGADVLVLPEINVALVGGDALAASSFSASEDIGSTDSPLQVIEPEYFFFADGAPGEYLRGFLRAAQTIAQDLGTTLPETDDGEEDVQVLGHTWGLGACRVPPSTRSGLGIKLAVLDTGMDLGHPDFAGRAMTSASFVGQPVQDLHSHGTHCIGTACGPRAPAGNTPRYGVAWRSHIFVGKVLANNGSSVGASVLAGMNWAIANRCQVISMSLGSQSPVQAAFTAAGLAALANGLLIIAASGNANGPTGAPANSPTIMSVASLDSNLRRSSFSNFGKVDIAAPGRDVYASVPRPQRYGYKTGTSMATPHVAGCAALWAQSSAGLRGQALWNRLLATARPLSQGPSLVGRGLVQAP